MGMKTIAQTRFFTGYILIGCSLLLIGCSSPTVSYSQIDSGDFQLPGFEKPYLLYLLASPHPRLYVEVDAVVGCAPSDATLKKLRNFLVTYCNKPGGVEIVRGDVIPRSAAQGITPEALARKYLKGPPDNNGTASAAFMCLLFYDGHLSDEPTVAEKSNLDLKMSLQPHPSTRNPRADFLPYPVIYMNMRYGPKQAQDWFVLHETGHLLGLVSRTTYASGLHCMDRDCLMYKTLTAHIGRMLLGQGAITQRKLCQWCVAELAQKSTELPPPNLEFVGPVLVRTESGYSVLSLPDRVKLIVGALTERDCGDFAAAVRAENPAQNADAHRVEWLVKKEALREPEKALDIIKQAKADPYDPVRFAASRTRTHSGTARYFAEGEYTNILSICRQSILADPNDDWSYNQIAWIKSTCPDASLRDGKDAVSYATKACELSEWKNWDWIDTLAAAYAEMGDFKLATEFAERALHTGNPPASDQREIRDRIALYKQNRPFRDKP